MNHRPPAGVSPPQPTLSGGADDRPRLPQWRSRRPAHRSPADHQLHRRRPGDPCRDSQPRADHSPDGAGGRGRDVPASRRRSPGASWGCPRSPEPTVGTCPTGALLGPLGRLSTLPSRKTPSGRCMPASAHGFKASEPPSSVSSLAFGVHEHDHGNQWGEPSRPLPAREGALGIRDATRLIELHSPVGWTNVATRRDLDVLRREVGALRGDVHRLDHRIMRFEDRVGKGFTTLDEQFVDIDNRLTRIEARFTHIGSGFRDVDGPFHHFRRAVPWHRPQARPAPHRHPNPDVGHHGHDGCAGCHPDHRGQALTGAVEPTTPMEDRSLNAEGRTGRPWPNGLLA